MTVNYLDRQVFSSLVPFFEDDLKVGPIDLAMLNVSFILPYGFVMIFVGRFIDRVGLRRGLASTYSLWNLAMLGHALVRGISGFVGVRFLLGVGESGMYPSAVKTAAEWFPTRERSLAMGIFNAAANCGALFAPLIGVAIAKAYGWRACFEVVGLLGMIWVFFWWRFFRSPEEHPKISPAELAYIRQDEQPPKPMISYSQLFGMRPVYGLALAKALTDAPFWIYLTWLPKFLVDQLHRTPTFMAWSIAGIYILADALSIVAGWFSTYLLQRGLPLGRARKIPMLIAAIMVIPAAAIGFLVDHPPIFGIDSAYWIIGIVALAVGAHQGWSCNLFTLISDTVPRSGAALATGAINGFAMVGVSAMQFFVGWSVQVTSSYTIPFILAGTLYMVALIVLHVIVPKVGPYPTTRRAKIPFVVAGGVALLAGLLFLQFQVNKPPYLTVADYETKRAVKLHATAPPVPGPAAKVGWMSAEWFKWTLPDGNPKYELVKFDTHAHPFVEEKGAKAAKYVGPLLADLPSMFK
jgi:ACS family hexuronate transporter-like MFS transporter